MSTCPSICPECDQPLKPEPPYPAWCPECGWNVVRDPAPSKPRFARLQAKLVHGLHAELLADATRTELLADDTRAELVADAPRAASQAPARRAGPARIASYVLACLVHLLAPALLITGAYLLTRLTVAGILFGLVALDLAWLLRPRPAPFPRGGQALARADAPALYALLDRIGTEVGAPPTDLVAISGDVNASFRAYGWRRRRLVEIGYPLWLLLGPQERVSLLAHEMAHSSNGDGRQGLVVGSALHSLLELRRVARFNWQPGDGVSQLLADCALAVVGVPVRGLVLVMELLLYRSSQRAEYRADELAARVGGVAATVDLLDGFTTWVVPAARFLTSGAVAAGTGDLWEALRAQVAAVPASELERRRRAGRLADLRVDSTHPPTHLRIEHAERLPYARPGVPAPDMEPIERELAAAAARVAQDLRETAQAALYH
ncbi:M48 family metalloprotease [Nonomuraea phyllanthi]|uniref:M48 family metalloprotease n=1 Tax=Nonomuraea phyllanthi TaxID=2219224 RepID=A0A5C4VZF1_9ACTN|nr:M48 family metallopeptidase [Nonomuraea phyllanthi]KAB8190574.1 M48 family metalloprotease [Nonomuraea phyllanthi]